MSSELKFSNQSDQHPNSSVKVKVIEVDDKGRVRVSAKALIEAPEPEEKKDD